MRSENEIQIEIDADADLLLLLLVYSLLRLGFLTEGVSSNKCKQNRYWKAGFLVTEAG